MKNTTVAWVWCVVGLGTLACGEPGATSSSFVVVDQQARSEGFAIESGGMVSDATLPLAFDATRGASLVGPNTEEPLTADPGELVFVHGEDATVRRFVIGQDIHTDRVRVDGSREAADELARRLGGELTDDGGRWRLVAPDALVESAGESAPPGLLGLEPVAIDDTTAPGPWEQTDTPSRGTDEPPPVAPETFEGFAAEDAVRPFTLVQGSRFIAVAGCQGVTGDWRARVYSYAHFEWYDFTLHVASANGSSLVGSVDVDVWDGLPDDDTTPAKCTGEFERSKVREIVRGRLLPESKLELESVSWRVERRICGDGVRDYYLDRFAGSVDRSGTKLEASVSDDGAWAAGMPVTFTRVRCGR